MWTISFDQSTTFSQPLSLQSPRIPSLSLLTLIQIIEDGSSQSHPTNPFTLCSSHSFKGRLSPESRAHTDYFIISIEWVHEHEDCMHLFQMLSIISIQSDWPTQLPTLQKVVHPRLSLKCPHERVSSRHSTAPMQDLHESLHREISIT